MAKQKGGQSKGRARNPAADDGGIFVSGKLVIIVLVGLAVAGAGFSWWFRYTATRRAARFWGPDAVTLIRDAPTVYLIDVGPMDPTAPHAHDASGQPTDHFHVAGGLWTVSDRRDVTHAHGLTHLRNNLLLDRTLSDVPWGEVVGENWRTGLEFHSGDAPPLVIFFSPDCSILVGHEPGRGPDRATRIASIAAGLRTVFAEWREPPNANASNQ